MDITTITLSKDVKAKLERLKRYNREPFNDVLARLLSDKNNNKEIDKDNLMETIDILSSPEIMRSLAKSLDDLKKGRTYSIDEV